MTNCYVPPLFSSIWMWNQKFWDLKAKSGLFWDHFGTLVPFGTKSQIRDLIGPTGQWKSELGQWKRQIKHACIFIHIGVAGGETCIYIIQTILSYIYIIHTNMLTFIFTSGVAGGETTFGHRRAFGYDGHETLSCDGGGKTVRFNLIISKFDD